MGSHGFFEIPEGAAGPRLHRLLRAAYKSSRDTKVFLWLKGTEPEKVNGLLGPVVAELGVEYSGVEFIRAEEDARARALADTAAFRVVFTASAERESAVPA